MFYGMMNGEYDVSEMSLAERVYYLTRDRCDFIAIPVFPSRLFRHRFILCNGSTGISGPQDLTGKQIGGLRWVQTAFVWLRGMLVEQHGLSPKHTRWYVSALHHWHGHGAEDKITPRDGSVIARFWLADQTDPKLTPLSESPWREPHRHCCVGCTMLVKYPC
jgi:hypothetical protein